ncbi:hypothetical protein PMAYCL1PPCAC_01428, partial [Pristionchus mayeri]
RTMERSRSRRDQSASPPIDSAHFSRPCSSSDRLANYGYAGAPPPSRHDYNRNGWSRGNKNHHGGETYFDKSNGRPIDNSSLHRSFPSKNKVAHESMRAREQQRYRNRSKFYISEDEDPLDEEHQEIVRMAVAQSNRPSFPSPMRDNHRRAKPPSRSPAHHPSSRPTLHRPSDDPPLLAAFIPLLNSPPRSVSTVYPTVPSVPIPSSSLLDHRTVYSRGLPRAPKLEALLSEFCERPSPPASIEDPATSTTRCALQREHQRNNNKIPEVVTLSSDDEGEAYGDEEATMTPGKEVSCTMVMAAEAITISTMATPTKSSVSTANSSGNTVTSGEVDELEEENQNTALTSPEDTEDQESVEEDTVAGEQREDTVAGEQREDTVSAAEDTVDEEEELHRMLLSSLQDRRSSQPVNSSTLDSQDGSDDMSNRDRLSEDVRRYFESHDQMNRSASPVTSNRFLSSYPEMNPHLTNRPISLHRAIQGSKLVVDLWSGESVVEGQGGKQNGCTQLREFSFTQRCGTAFRLSIDTEERQPPTVYYDTQSRTSKPDFSGANALIDALACDWKRSERFKKWDNEEKEASPIPPAASDWREEQGKRRREQKEQWGEWEEREWEGEEEERRQERRRRKTSDFESFKRWKKSINKKGNEEDNSNDLRMMAVALLRKAEEIEGRKRREEREEKRRGE